MSDFGGNDDVVIRGRFDTTEISQGVAELHRQLMQLNGGAGGPAGLPMGAPASAPVPPSPSGSFSGGSSSPMGVIGGPTTPGIFAPVAPGSTRATGSSFLGGSSAPLGSMPGMGGGMMFMTSTVNIQASVVNLHTSNVQGLGGIGGGAGGGGNGPNLQPNGAPIPNNTAPGVNAPPPPGGGGGGGGGGVPSPPGGSWGAFFHQIAQNPTLGGIVNAGLNQMPLGSLAALGFAAEIGSTAMNAAYAGQRPQYQLETSLMSQRLQGQYVNPIIEAGQYRSATIRGEIAAERATLAPITSLPLIGGALGSLFELSGFLGMGNFQERERAAELAVPKAIADQQKLYLARMTGLRTYDMAESDSMRGLKIEMARRLNPFGTGAASTVADMGFDSNTLAAFGVEGVAGAMGAITQMGFDPNLPGLRRNMSSLLGKNGAHPDLLHEAAAMAALHGNLQGVSQLFPLFPNGGGAYNNYVGVADEVLGYQRELGMSRSRLSIARNTGQDIGAITGEFGAQEGQLKRWIQRVRQARDASPAGLKGDFDAFLLELEAQQTALPRQSADAYYGYQGQLYGAEMSSASTGFQRGLYGGLGERGLDPLFGRRRSAGLASAGLYRERSRRMDVYSPAERAAFAAMAEQEEFQATVGLAREQSQTTLGIGMGRAGLTSAFAQTESAFAGLFGNAGDMQRGGLMQAGGIREQIAAIEAFLKRGNLSLQEQLQYQAQIVNLRRQEVETTEQAYRGAARQTLGVAQGNYGIGQTELSRSFLLGGGGMVGFAGASGVANQAASVATAAAGYVAMLRQRGVSEDNPEMIQARQQLASAQMGQSQSVLALGQVPMPLAMTQATRRGEFALGVMQRTYASYGDIRGTVTGLMDNAGREMRMLHDMEAEAERSGRFRGAEGEALRAEFENRRMEVGNRLVGYQQQLENGWQDRLISQVSNAPGSFNYIASGFTRREASRFLGAISPAFGFRNASERDAYMERGPRLADSLIGNITRPEGFLETALSGGSLPRHGGGGGNAGLMNLLMGGGGGGGTSGGGQEITIRVILEDTKGNPLGAANQRTVIGALGNGAIDLTANRNAQSAPRN